jgi:DNA polymerase IV
MADVVSQDALRAIGLTLIRSVLPTEKGVRLVGVTVSNFDAPAPVAEVISPQLFAVA